MTFTILTGEFQHESHSFSRLNADYQAFLSRALYLGNDAVVARVTPTPDLPVSSMLRASMARR